MIPEAVGSAVEVPVMVNRKINKAEENGGQICTKNFYISKIHNS